MSVCIAGGYFIWKIRKRLAAKEPQLLTYHPTAEHLNNQQKPKQQNGQEKSKIEQREIKVDHNSKESNAMAFENGGFSKDNCKNRNGNTQMLKNGGFSSSPKSIKDMNKNSSSHTLMLEGVTMDETSEYDIIRDKDVLSVLSNHYESLPGSEGDHHTEVIVRVTDRHMNDDLYEDSCAMITIHDSGNDISDRENTYEELPGPYENMSRRGSNTEEAENLQCMQDHYDESQYENISHRGDTDHSDSEEEIYLEPTPRGHSNYSSRTLSSDTTDFGGEERMLGMHPNVNLISISEMSVDIRSCPDTPLFNCRGRGLDGAHSSGYTSSGGFGYPPRHLSEELPATYFCSESMLHYAPVPEEGGIYSTSSLGRRSSRQTRHNADLDESWEMRTSF